MECLKRAEKTSGGVVLTINNLNFNLIIYVHIFNTTESVLDKPSPRGSAGVVRPLNLILEVGSTRCDARNIPSTMILQRKLIVSRYKELTTIRYNRKLNPTKMWFTLYIECAHEGAP